MIALGSLAGCSATAEPVDPETDGTGVIGQASLQNYDTLEDQRDRLMNEYAIRRGMHGAKCALWFGMSPSQMGTFLTITDRLHRAKLPDGKSALWHVSEIASVRGEHAPGVCGGIDQNRLFLTVSPALHQALWRVATYGGNAVFCDGSGCNVPLTDFGGGWRKSEDLAGPHPPFDMSIETNAGGPRAQVHFWADPNQHHGQHVNRSSLDHQPFTGYLVEVDQDYNFQHDSSTECTYCGFAGCKTGRTMYGEATGGGGFLDFTPCDCPLYDSPSAPIHKQCQPMGQPPPPAPPPSMCLPTGFPCWDHSECCNYQCWIGAEGGRGVCVGTG